MKKRLISLLIVVMTVGAMLLSGCSGSNVENGNVIGTHDGRATEEPINSEGDNKTSVANDNGGSDEDTENNGDEQRFTYSSIVVDGNAENCIDESKMAGINRFIVMHDNGKGVRQFANEEEREMFSSPKIIGGRELFISYAPEVFAQSPEDYIKYVTNKPLILNFIGAENFAPINKIEQFHKEYADDSCHYCYNICLNTRLNVRVEYFDSDTDVSNIFSKDKNRILSSEKQIGERYKFSDRVIAKYFKGSVGFNSSLEEHLMELSIYTDYAKIEVYAYDSSYKRCDLGEVLVEIDSWLANFVDSEKWASAIADANQYVKRIVPSEK